MPHTTSPRSPARRRSISRAPRRSTACRLSHRAGFCVLKLCLAASSFQKLLHRARPWLAWARARDEADTRITLARPSHVPTWHCGQRSSLFPESSVGSPIPMRSTRRRSSGSRRCPPSASPPMRRCAAASCTRRWPGSSADIPSSCHPIRRTNCSGSPVTCWRNIPGILACRVLGAAAGALRGLVRRDRAKTPGEYDAHRRRGPWQARGTGAG